MNQTNRQRIEGPFWAGRNWSADIGTGSIHDDATAEKLGFRGGTVAGDVHMVQFPPVLERFFGDAWWRTGLLSLDFKFATVDQERVRVIAEPTDNPDVAQVFMERDDGTLICSGVARIDAEGWATNKVRRDLRPCDPSELSILAQLDYGLVLCDKVITLDPDKQFERFDTGVLSDPIDAYRHGERFGEPIAAPCTFVQYMWGPPTKTIETLVTPGTVGLFGAIDIGHHNGPFLLNREYRIRSEVVSLGQSPKTEYVWFDTSAEDSNGKLVATFRMQLRFMKG